MTKQELTETITNFIVDSNYQLVLFLQYEEYEKAIELKKLMEVTYKDLSTLMEIITNVDKDKALNELNRMDSSIFDRIALELS